MSRSYKKTPYTGDTKGKDKKHLANSKVRARLRDHDYELADGGAFKKIYEQYEICDYGWIMTWPEYWHAQVDSYERYGGDYPNKKQEYRKWIKWYRSK